MISMIMVAIMAVVLLFIYAAYFTIIELMLDRRITPKKKEEDKKR
jgi:hypothetical protein